MIERMEFGDSARSWRKTVIARSALLGAALGVLSICGTSLLLPELGSGTASASVLVATILVGLGIGVWAAGQEDTGAPVRIRERWLSAASTTALGGAFATFWSLYEQLYPGRWWPVAGLLVVLAVPAYGLGLLVAVLLRWSRQYVEEMDEAETGDAALGPFFGGVLGGAMLGLLLAGLIVLPRAGAATLIMGAAVALLLPLLFSDPPVAVTEETGLFETVTSYGSLRVTEIVFAGERQPERRLYLNGEQESGELARSGTPTLGYVAAAEQLIASITPPGSGYLFLGGGAYTLPRRIAERDPRAKLAVVELDPEVTAIAYKYFGLRPEHGVRSVHGDARAYLEAAASTEFDRIYVDVYAGRESLPYSLVTVEAAELLARRLAPSGVVAMNLIGMVTGEESKQLWSVVATFAEVFPSVAVYTHLGRDFPERQNVLLVAAPAADREFPLAAAYFEIWPRAEWPARGGWTIFRDLLVPRGRTAPSPTPAEARERV